MRFVQSPGLLDLADRLRGAAVERVAQAPPDVDDGGRRKAVEQARLNGEHQRDFVGEPQRRMLRLIEDRADARAARELLADAGIRHAAEAGEHLQFEELGVVEPQRSRRRRAARAPGSCRRPG